MTEFFNTIWLSQGFGLFLWLVLFSVLFAPMLVEWWKHKKDFDLFEAKHIFRLVYFLYFGIPSIYYLFSPKNFAHVTDFDNSLRIVLVFAIIGAIAFYLGYRIKLPWKVKLPQSDWSAKRLAALVAAFTAISITSFSLLMERVGGACYYFTHLGQTNELMVGNTYFLWGILLFKTAAILLLAYLLKAKTRPWWLWTITGFYLVTALMLVAFMGSRILAVIFIFEVLVVINYLARKINIFILTGIIALVGVLIIGVLGEFRNFSWVAPDLCQANSSEASLEYLRHKNSTIQSTASAAPIKPPTIDRQQYINAFGQELGKVASDKELLASRYIDNYFDSVRTTMMTYENTPQILRYQYGLGYLQAALQPIPGSVRPEITLPNQDNIFNEGKNYARVQSLLAEAYMNFGWFGIALVPFLMGIITRFAYTIWQANTTNRWAAIIYAAAIGGLMIYIRGYFTGHTALFLMDLTPLLGAMLILHWPLRRTP